MLNAKSFLAVDFGAGSLKLGEFELNEAGGLRLKRYGTKSLGVEGSQESTREAVILKGLQQLIAEQGAAAKDLSVCAPGFHVFSKFVKLPPVDTAKVTQIIQYEAQQNVPFPLEEVVWDYQILGTSNTGELEVLLVAIKSDIVDGLFRVAEGAGLRVQLVDVSPAALCNAFRYNYGDLEGCTMLLDIGAKTSNLLFFEKGKVYSRSINIGSNSITQDFANEAKLPFGSAEQVKTDKGFVSLGGAYEEPEDPQASAISKIARQVMTRLHIQVNQTIQFYRGQQGGSAPQRLFLSGGGSILPYTAQFFAEKLNVPVEYFNPFRNIQIDPAISLEDLSKVAHSFGEVVGLGLRSLAHCPVELNLMPKSSIKRQEFGQKKPYFIAAILSLALVIFAIGMFYDRLLSIRKAKLVDLNNKVTPLKTREGQLRLITDEVADLARDTGKVVDAADKRVFWTDVFSQFQNIFTNAEAKAESQFKTDVGLWIESFRPVVPGYDAEAEEVNAEMDDLMRQRYRVPPTRANPQSKTIETIRLVCRGINIDRVRPGANTELIYLLLDEIKARPEFFRLGDKGTDVSLGTIGNARREDLTFSFDLQVTLKKAYKL
jgi:type IV pilus assembly protein PilM